MTPITIAPADQPVAPLWDRLAKAGRVDWLKFYRSTFTSEKVECVILQSGVDPRLAGEVQRALGQGRMARLPGAVQRGVVILIRLLELLPDISRDLVLSDPQRQRRGRAHHQHHRDKHAEAETGDAWGALHGKLILTVPLPLSVTVFTSVVWLLIQAFS